MIENFRKIAKNPVMKVLLLVLVVSFMLSGLSAGVLSQAADNYIVKVADEKIYPSQIENEYKNIARTLSERGVEVDDEMLASMGITQEKILNDLVQRKLIFAEISAIGLTVSNDFLRKEIISSPLFQVEGKFDNDTFKRFLYIRGLREHQYLDEMRKEISGEAMMQILFDDIKTPSTVFELLKNRAATKYDIEAAYVPADFAELKKTATDAELKDFYFVNSVLFERPETRDVSYIEIKMLEDQKASHEMATALEDEIAGGATIDEVAKKHNAPVKKLLIDANTNKNISELAAALDEGELSEVKETDDKTYIVVQLDKVTEKHVPELDKIKDEVVKEWVIAEKQKLSRQFAIDAFEKSKEEGKFSDEAAALKKQNFNKISAQEFAQKGLSKLRGITPAEAKKGQIFGLYETADSGYLITRLSNSQVALLTQKEIAEYTKLFNNSYVSELQQSYLQYLAAKHGVEFNENFQKKQ